MKVTVEGIEYTIKPLEPWQMPYLQRYLKLSGQVPKDNAEAEKLGEELQSMLVILLRDVTPKPKEEHKLILFNAINAYSMRLNEEVTKVFRGESRVLEELLRSGSSDIGRTAKSETK